MPNCKVGDLAEWIVGRNKGRRCVVLAFAVTESTAWNAHCWEVQPLGGAYSRQVVVSAGRLITFPDWKLSSEKIHTADYNLRPIRPDELEDPLQVERRHEVHA